MGILSRSHLMACTCVFVMYGCATRNSLPISEDLGQTSSLSTETDSITRLSAGLKAIGQTQPSAAPKPMTRPEVRFEYKYALHIMMTYTLDLGRDNRIAPMLIKDIAKLDANFRQCYSQQLDSNSALKGTISFAVAKAEGSRKFILTAGDHSMANQKLKDCLHHELSQVSISEPYSAVRTKGNLIYNFDSFTSGSEQAVAAK